MVTALVTVFLLGVFAGMVFSFWLSTVNAPIDEEIFSVGKASIQRGNITGGKSPNPQPPPPEQGGIALGRSWRAQRELLERGTMEGPPPKDSLQKLEEKVERIKAGA